MITFTRIAEEAIPGGNLLVKEGSTASQCALCGASDSAIGVSAGARASGKLVTIEPIALDVQTLVASGAIAFGATVEQAAGGKVATYSSGIVVGVAYSTAAGDGDMVVVSVNTGASASSVASSLRGTITSASHGFSAEEVLYITGAGAYAKAQADAIGTARPVGVVESATANTFVLVYGGTITLAGKTPGDQHYLSPGSAGALTTTEPTTVGQYHVPVLRATSATQGIVEIGEPVLIADESLVTSDETLAYAATVNIDFGSAIARRTKRLALTGNVILTGSGYANGAELWLEITADATNRTVNVPAGWKFAASARPGTLEALEKGILHLRCLGATEDHVFGTWVPQGRSPKVEDLFGGTGTVSGRTPDSLNVPGDTWTALGANALDSVSGGKALTDRFFEVACGSADGVVEVDLVLPAAAGTGGAAFFRVTNATNYWAAAAKTDTGLLLQKNVAGTPTQIATVGDVANYAEGSAHRIRVELSGTSIKVYDNGLLLHNITDSDHQSVQNHGFGGWAGAGTAKEFDNFRYSNLT